MLTLAVVDDLGTILVIAVFFTDDLSFGWLGACGRVRTGHRRGQRGGCAQHRRAT